MDWLWFVVLRVELLRIEVMIVAPLFGFSTNFRMHVCRLSEEHFEAHESALEAAQ